MRKVSYIVSLIVLSVQCTTAQMRTLSVDAAHPGAEISRVMYGVFFEDINFGADGGIYAEMVKNRSFEFAKPLTGWKVQAAPVVEGAVTVQNRQLAGGANPRYLQVIPDGFAPDSLRLVNEGFRGMGLKRGMTYDFTCSYRNINGRMKIRIALLDSSGVVAGETIIEQGATGNTWQTIRGKIISTITDPKGKLRLSFTGSGRTDLDMISLFPADTWKGRPGGMRADMVQLLADMKPGFIRFPGGCIVEGFDLNNRYQWKRTIGPLEDRQLIINRWNVEFAHRPAPDYFQTFGLGFFEYFQLAEDVGAEPLPILNCGMACQFNTAEVVPLDQLDPYVQDALDLIEFANGNAQTKWGARRVALGHPEPFGLEYIGIGNENWGPQYLERLEVFRKSIREKYPEIQIVASSGTDPDGGRFDLLNRSLREMGIDLIDEHYYRKPEWFLSNASRYDPYPRNGSKVFAGEYAAHDANAPAEKRNTWLAALSEAAFLTGLERNADVVRMASYAPLFAHVDAWQWNPDLIWVDNLRVVGSASYQVQKLFSLNKGTRMLPITEAGINVSGKDSLYASAALDDATGEVIIKLVNVSSKPQQVTLLPGGKRSVKYAVHTETLQSNELSAFNSFSQPANISVQKGVFESRGDKIFDRQILARSVNIFRLAKR